MKIDGIDLTAFDAGKTTRALYKRGYRDIPKRCGVYVIVRLSKRRRRFLTKSPAGRYKRRSPSFPIGEVRGAWVPGARIVYIGKAAGARGLRQRLRQLIRFGFGHAIGHRGGRMLWHLADHKSLRVRWLECPRSKADRLETRLIAQFKEHHRGVRPFANRAK